MGSGTSIEFALRADGLGIFFALLALVIGAVVFLYSAAYLPDRDGNTSFYTIMTAFTLSVLLLVLADDAVLLDTSELNFEQSFEAMKKMITEKVG